MRRATLTLKAHPVQHVTPIYCLAVRLAIKQQIILLCKCAVTPPGSTCWASCVIPTLWRHGTPFWAQIMPGMAKDMHLNASNQMTTTLNDVSQHAW